MSKFSTFFKSNSSDKEPKGLNFGTKFLSGLLDSKDTCIVGGCNFKLLSGNKYTCSSCSQTVCKEHSYEEVGEEIVRICENCRTKRIVEENEVKTKEEKELLYAELRVLDEERQRRTAEISKIGARIRKVVKSQQENLLTYNLKEEEIRQELEKAKKDLEALETDYKEVKVQFEVAQISEGKSGIKLNRVNQNLENLKIEAEALESENHDQKSNLDELEKSAQQKIPIRLVKETICKICLMKVSLTHAVMFKNVLPMAEEKRQVPQNEEIQKKICACRIV